MFFIYLAIFPLHYGAPIMLPSGQYQYIVTGVKIEAKYGKGVIRQTPKSNRLVLGPCPSLQKISSRSIHHPQLAGIHYKMSVYTHLLMVKNSGK